MRSLQRRAGTRWSLTLVLAAAAGLAGCQEGITSADPEVDPADVTGDAAALLAATDASVLEAMGIAIVDEYRAEATYNTVLATFGDVLPFRNIVNAETRHWQSIAKLYGNRGLPVPENLWTAETIPVFETLTEACDVGVAAEIANAAMYDGFLEMELPDDVRQVFTTNRDASDDHHLPAFQRCAS